MKINPFQKINLRLVIVHTGASKFSNTTISSAEIILPRKFKHSIVDSLNAFAKISMSSIMIKLFEMSKSLISPFLITSDSNIADWLPILVSDKWHTFNDFDCNKPSAILLPASSPI